MFDSTLHIPLKFYDAVEKQDRFRLYSTTKRFTMYSDATHLPEFQIKMTLNDDVSSVKLVDIHTDQEIAITFGSDFYVVDFTASSYAIYNRTLALAQMAYGDYYLKVTSTSDIYYSEVFTITDITNKTIIEYYNTNDIANIDYTNTPNSQFKLTLIFDSVLAKPEYIIEEEAVEDGDGNQLVTFQRRVKLFKLWFYAPEYIVDAVSLIGLHDFVTLTTHYLEANTETGLVYDFAMTSEWNESKGLAKITCEFRDSPVIKTTCANNIT